MPESREWTLDGHGGALVARTWETAGDPSYVALLAHGYGEHIGRYEHVAAALVADGAVVYAVDHVGHGKRSREEHPGLPVVLIGHSMGGLIAARYAQRYADSLTAVVLSGPLIGGWEAGGQLLALPEIPDVPLDITTLSRDPRVGKDYDSDPLVWHGPFKRTTVEAIDHAITAIAEGPSLGSLPLMWAHGEADQLVPVVGSRSGIEHLKGEHYVEHIYPGARHEIFNEINADEVLADVTAFIDGALKEAQRG
jgi:alpha-beta hydrolase superfamily lysophospholipase